MKYNKQGVFRKFAFIGYQTEDEAQAAIRRFNQTYFDTQKIQVDLARDFGDASKPRAWSKYSSESSYNINRQKELKQQLEEKEKKKAEKKKKKEKVKNPVVEEILGDLKDDPNFQEFLQVHQNVGTKPVWGDDNDKSKAKGEKPVPKAISAKMSDLPFEDDTDGSDDDEYFESKSSKAEKMDTQEDNEEEEDTVDKTKKTGLSDLDYLKSKVCEAVSSDSSDSDTDNEAQGTSSKHKEKKSTKRKEKEKVQSSSSESDSESEHEQLEKPKLKGNKKEMGKQSPDDKVNQKDVKKSIEVPEVITEEEEVLEEIHILKVKGIPPSSGERAIREFFHPIKIVSLKMPKTDKHQSIGIAYPGFKNEADVLKALGRSKNFIGGKKVFVNRYKVEKVENKIQDKAKLWEQKKDDLRNVDIADTGRLYLRNLSFTCTEEDLENTFSKFGPLVEIHLPIDHLTKKVKGFAFLTYLMPEHAVQAFTEMDGKVYQGRMLHVLPGKEKIEEEDISDEKSSFKKQKQQKQKMMAGSSHNWNTLFLGANTVADVMVNKYNTTKSDILDNSGKGSLGVRMALGETQIVSETREFLTKNGVSLDSFSQANAPRSKSVLLVKNLPAGTTESEIQTLFSKHGTLGRVILPPSGVTAIVEYTIPTEAKLAFRRLAYSKFHHIPLYLEWAPVEVFTSEAPSPSSVAPPTDKQGDVEMKPPKQDNKRDTSEKQSVMEVDTEKEEQKEAEDDDDDDDDGPGSVLFVKNINFDTSEESLKKLFEKCAKVRKASVSKKKDLKNPGQMLSMGYGFVEFKFPDGAMKAIQKMQHADLDGHSLELKISNKTTLDPNAVKKTRKKQKETKQHTTKILVRNIPFEAQRHEIDELFKVFGEIKTVRLPKKMTGTGSHRGFGFVDFLTKHDAKRAFEALCHSTHLYGRRLVLEWANTEEDLDEIRKRTAENYNEGSGKKKRFTKSGLVESLEGTMAGEFGL